MRLRILVLVAVGTLGGLLAPLMLLAATPAAPVPKDEPVYYPARVGARWVVRAGEAEVTYVVTAVEQKAEGGLVSVGIEKGGQVKPHKKVLVSGEGVFEVELGGAAIKPPNCLLKRAARPGDSWVTEATVGDTTLRVKRICRAPELVEVPAGKFKAVRVDEERTTAEGTTYKTSSWYAPEVGLVKVEMADGDAALVLKSFTPAKD